MARNQEGIYAAIEGALRDSDDPLTCIDLWEMPKVRQYAAHVNYISDTLGQMWRRGYLKRTPAPKDKDSAVKWSYTWGDSSKSVRKETRQPEATVTPIKGDGATPAPAGVTVTRKGDEVTIRIVLKLEK